MPITLTDALAQELGGLFEDEQLEIDGFEYVLCEESDQTNELKHVLWDRIYKRNDNKFFVQHCSKSGAYWSDYEFEYGDHLYEVKKVEVRKSEWKLV